PGSRPCYLGLADSSNHCLLSIMHHPTVKSCHQACQFWKSPSPIRCRKLQGARSSLVGRSELERALPKPLLQKDAVCEQPVGVALANRLGDLVHLVIEQPELLPQYVERRLAGLDPSLRRVARGQRKVRLE